jgi:hypothetical protein
MRAVVLRKSKVGLIAAGLFLSAFIGLLAWIFFVASKNPADSGESGILLLPFGMPWVMWLPVEWMGMTTGFLCVALNAFIVYCLCGGLRPRKKI